MGKPEGERTPIRGRRPKGAADGSRPAYLELAETGELRKRARQASRHLKDCDLCARYCRVDRTRSVRGVVCRTGARAVVSSFGPHHGEEAPLRGRRGSGTIFFSWCNLRCVFCQNWEISWKGHGEEVTAGALAEIMLQLQEQGCHNINFVSPSHAIAQIIEAVAVAQESGLNLPLVYNTGGYDSPEALALLDGIIDIYMPDMKYGCSDSARKYSKIRDYAAVNRAAIKEMHRQVGDLVLDSRGIARRGLLVRHLVLPGGLAATETVLAFLADEISKDTYLNLMDQYRPCHKASGYPELDRRPSATELLEAMEAARRVGLHRLDKRYPPAYWDGFFIAATK